MRLLTPPRSAMSSTRAPAKPFSANSASAALRMRCLVALARMACGRGLAVVADNKRLQLGGERAAWWHIPAAGRPGGTK